MYVCMYIYIYTHTHVLYIPHLGKTLDFMKSCSVAKRRGFAALLKREREYRSPTLHYRLSRKLPEVSGDFCNNKTGFL